MVVNNFFCFICFLAAGKTSLFTLKFNYGGQFEDIGNGNLQYVNCHVDYFDHCDIDHMSMLELEDFAERLGYKEHVSFHYRVSAANVRVLEDDMDVMSLFSMVEKDRVVEFFMVYHVENQVEFDFFQEYVGFSLLETKEPIIEKCSKEAAEDAKDLHDVPLQTEKVVGEEQAADFFDSDYEQFDEVKVTKEAASRQQGRGANFDYVGSSSKGK